MYIGSWKIDDLLTFSVNTHTPATQAAVDADSAPTYRVYEDETGTPILTGTMALLDDANTLGFYSEQITLSAANGFEKGKSYNVRIAGVVGGVTGITTRNLQIEAEVDANTLSGPLTTYTGNTPQTGDSFARLGAAGAGLTALGDSRIANLDVAVSTRGTSTYAGGAVASVAGAVGSVTGAVGSVTGGATAAALSSAASDIAAVKVVSDKLADTLEDSGGGAYVFTEAALANGPAGGGGGGGDATLANQVTIMAALAEITPQGSHSHIYNLFDNNTSAPIAGAIIEARLSASDNATIVARGITDLDGNATLSFVAAGTAYVWATAQGYKRVSAYKITVQ